MVMVVLFGRKAIFGWVGLRRLICTLAALPWLCLGQVDVLTYHYDQQRTGQNLRETILRPANVKSDSFGKLFNHEVDGDIYGQILYCQDLDMGEKGVHNVVFVTTSHDSIYAFDADSNEGENAQPLWHRSYIDPDNGIIPVPSVDSWYDPVQPEIGIAGTPVIDRESGTIYFVVKRKEISGTGSRNAQYFCAVDITTGEDRPGSPVEVGATVPGVGDGAGADGILQYSATRQHQRAALLLHDGIVYVASASFGGTGPYHGWILGYNAATLQQEVVYCTTPNGAGGGVWMSGNGPGLDADGNLFVVTGNGTYFQDGANQNFGDSAIKLRRNGATLEAVDWFTPFNQATLEWSDTDLGSGGFVLLPPQPGDHPSQMVFCGKEGKIYVVDRDNMGRFQPDTDSQIIESFAAIPGGVWGKPAYFNQRVYYHGVGDVLKMFALKDGLLDPTPAQSGARVYKYPGAIPVISANGTNDAILWELQVDAYVANYGNAILRAYDAYNVNRELYNSSQVAGRDVVGGAIRFTIPTVANGKVYVPAHKQLSIFGLSQWVPAPEIISAGIVFTNATTVVIKDADPAASITYTLDGTEPVANSPPYTGPITLDHSAAVKARAFSAGKGSSPVVSLTLYEAGSIGTGTGLRGEYFSQQNKTFSYPATLGRTDAQINFSWGLAPPAPGIYPANFTVRWTGFVQPQFSEAYSFIVRSHSGARLWIDGELVVDQWTDAPSADGVGTIELQAGKLYELRMDYYQSSSAAEAILSWRSPSTQIGVIPTSQLYPATNSYSSFAFTGLETAQALTAGTNVTLSVTTPYFAVSRVEFYLGTTKLGDTKTYPYEFVWTNLVAGKYSLTARAMDDYGTQVATVPLAITVNCPALNVSVAARKVTLSWAAAGPGYTVEAADLPAPSLTWRAISQTPTYSNGLAKVTFDMPAERRFYRLRPSIR